MALLPGPRPRMAYRPTADNANGNGPHR